MICHVFFQIIDRQQRPIILNSNIKCSLPNPSRCPCRKASCSKMGLPRFLYIFYLSPKKKRSNIDISNNISIIIIPRRQINNKFLCTCVELLNGELVPLDENRDLSGRYQNNWFNPSRETHKIKSNYNFHKMSNNKAINIVLTCN